MKVEVTQVIGIKMWFRLYEETPRRLQASDVNRLSQVVASYLPFYFLAEQHCLKIYSCMRWLIRDLPARFQLEQLGAARARGKNI